jgi:hypothetical protein
MCANPDSKIFWFWESFDGRITKDILDFIARSEIRTIIFNTEFNSMIDNLPDCIREIKFRNTNIFKQPINKLPANLESLDLCSNYPYLIYCWPASIKHINIENNMHMISCLPPYLYSLKTAYLFSIQSKAFDFDIHFLPIGLKRLELEYGDIDELDGVLPPELAYLKINFARRKSRENKIENKELPETLKSILVHYND